MNEGIIFGGYLLTKDEFDIIFKQWYHKKGQAFKSKLQTDIIDVINEMVISESRVNTKGELVSVDHRIRGKYNAAKIYQAWENITSEFFGNGEVTLIAGVTYGGSQYKWTNNIKESDVMSASGINLRKRGLTKLQEQMEATQAIMAAEEVQNILNNHYGALQKALIDYHMDKESAQQMHIILSKRKSTIALRHFTDRNYEDVIFSGQRNADGKKLDAFMNHVGKHHAQLFGLMNSQKINASTLANSQIHYKDDNFMEYFQTKSPLGEPQEWLLDSLNTAGWMTGGDVVVVGPYGEIIYNIQLKTTAQKGGKTFELSHKALLEFSKSLVKLFEEESSPEKIQAIGDAMYAKLKTNSANNFEAGDNFIREKTLELVKNTLKLS